MSDLVVRYLAARPDGADALAIGREALALQGPAAIVAEIAARIARAVPGVAESGGRFVLLGPPGRILLGEHGSPVFLRADPSIVALEARTTGRYPPLDQLLEVATVPVDRAARDRGYHAYVRPVRPIPAEVAGARGVSPESLASGVDLDEVLDMLALALAGRTVVVFGSDAGATWIQAALMDRGRACPAGVLRLRPALTAARLVSGRADLGAAAAALGTPTPLVHDALTSARTIALMTAEAVARRIPLRPPEAPAFDFTGRAFDAATLAALPTAPGVYRFYAADDALLYVGKAHDLRARVASYFRPGGDGRRRAAELRERVHRLAVEVTGSELAALLREHALIRELHPQLNVQRDVGRRHPVSGDLALLLPAAGAGWIDILLIRDGRIAERTAATTRGVGMRGVRRSIKRAFFASHKSLLLADRGPQAAAGGGERRSATDSRAPRAAPDTKTLAPAPRAGSDRDDADAEAQIVASWLRDERALRAHNVVDLSDCRGVDAAARRLKASLIDPDIFRERIVHR